MKKNALLILFASIILSCKGPAGKDGLPGPAGANGKDGANGASGPAGAVGATGPAGTATKARYYDFTLTFAENSPSAITDYKVKDYDYGKEMPFVYIISQTLVMPLPLYNHGVYTLAGGFNLVEMVVTSTISNTGLLFIDEWNYEKNPSSTYKFRVVLIPIQPGGKLNTDSKIPFEELSKKYQLFQGK